MRKDGTPDEFDRDREDWEDAVERLAALIREADKELDMTDETSWDRQLAAALLPRLASLP